MTTLASGDCANCDRAIAGPEQKFCPACGQPTPAHRIDWHFLGHELEHSVLHMDRGIFYSLKELMLRPGHLMRDYIEGRRANQVKPLLLLMITAAAVVFLSKYLLAGDVLGSAFVVTGGETTGTGAAIKFNALLVEVFTAVRDWTNAHYAAAALLLLPLEAAAFRLAFRGMGLNYPEWLVLATYITVQAFVIMTVTIVLRHWLPQAQAWGLWLSLAYALFSLAQFFKGYPGWQSVLRGIFGFVLYFLMQTVLILALVLGVYLITRGG